MIVTRELRAAAPLASQWVSLTSGGDGRPLFEAQVMSTLLQDLRYALAAGLAIWLPARSAARVDPASALRAE